MVQFETQNLLGLLDGGAAAFCDFDLILCRNVLIYFDAETVYGLVRAFGRRLKPDGWLLLGHAEPHPAFCDLLDVSNLPGTVTYRPRGADPVPRVPTMAPPTVREPTAWIPLPVPEMQVPPRSPQVSAIVEATPPETSALDRIRTLADAGETAEAWRAVRAALVDSPTEAALHYYEGLLAWSLGREAEAERALRGALYLDRDFVMAHYQLGLLLIAGGRRADAARMLDNAVRIGRRLPADARLPEGDGTRAGQLVVGATLARDGLEESVA
jgi:chemotaxis protein methyltransferase CheR